MQELFAWCRGQDSGGVVPWYRLLTILPLQDASVASDHHGKTNGGATLVDRISSRLL